jgi:hypothetical protein
MVYDELISQFDVELIQMTNFKSQQPKTSKSEFIFLNQNNSCEDHKSSNSKIYLFQ